MKKTLYVHPDETIAYLIDRIENTEGDVLMLVADANPALFGDPVNLKFLKREAEAFGKQCIIVSQDQDIIRAAQSSGFETVSEDVSEEAQNYASEASHDESDEEMVPVHIIHAQEHQESYEAPRETYASHVQEEAVHDEPADESDSDDNAYSEEPAEKRRRMPLNWKFLGASVVIIALVGMGVFSVLSPKLSVVIMPKKETINFDFQVVVDSSLANVNLAKARVPGQIIKTDREVSDSFTATGKQDKATKAEGDVIIYNVFGPTSQSLVKNTRFKSKDGLIFRLQSTVIVPAAKMTGTKVSVPGTASAHVVADQTGPSYNIDPTDFSIPGFQGTPKFLGFYAKSAKAFSGGGSSNATFATRDDLDKARMALSAKLAQGVQEYIASQIPKGMKVVPEAIIAGDAQLSSGAVDVSSAQFKATLKTSYMIFAFSESDVAALADYNIAGKISETRKAITNTRVITYADQTVGQDKTTLSFTAKISELMLGAVDQNDLRRLLAGKDELEIRQILGANDSIDSAEITFWPLWASKAPANPDAIKVSVNES